VLWARGPRDPGSALILGAGGAARAAAVALADVGWSVAVSARRADAAAGIGFGVEPWPARNLPELVVNATPVGQAGDPGNLPVDAALLGATITVIDLAYLGDGRPTALCAAAAAAGATVVSGLDVLVGQGIFAFELFTGLPAPVDAMWAAARA
jgi:shikimate dehydrogenase